MYRYLIVPNAFKDCLPALDVGLAIQKGILSKNPKAETTVIPIADGGQGTVDAILYSVGGTKHYVPVKDPLMRDIEAFFGILPDGKTAIVEMAAASGLELLLPTERNPLKTTSYGTGQLIKFILDMNCDHLILGIGGSATNDGGTGMMHALGVRFIDKNGLEIFPCGGNLHQIKNIDISEMDKRLKQISIQVMTDVNNVFFGSLGATSVFGPQKGANSQMVIELENGMIQLAEVINKQFFIDVNTIKGGGAAGGMGALLKILLQAELVSGIQFITEMLQLEVKIQNVDVIITAEGSFDNQTFHGKAPIGIAKLAQKYMKSVFIFSGSINNIGNLAETGISAVVPITQKPVTLAEAILRAPEWLEMTGYTFASIFECHLVSSENQALESAN